MAMSKRLVLLTTASLVLSGCCIGSQGYIHPTAGTLTSWDKLGPTPERNKVKFAKAHKKSAMVASRPASSPKEDAFSQESELDGLKPYSKEWWSVRDTIDRAYEAELSKKLIICRNCISPAPDDQTGSIPHQ